MFTNGNVFRDSSMRSAKTKTKHPNHFPGPQLLPITAEYADIETMSILASHPLKLSYDLSVDSLAANQGILRQRRNYDEKLSEAFEELISIAQAEEGDAGSIENLMESAIILLFEIFVSFRAGRSHGKA